MLHSNFLSSKRLPIYLVLLFSLLIRLYQLDALSLFGDEIDVGYHAWSLATTGRDYYGQLLPSYIHSLSEWRAPLLMYVTAPFVGLLGPSLWSVRLPVVLLGVANIYLIYLLTNLLFDQKFKLKVVSSSFTLDTGLIAALVLAITPWHFHYSRAAFESTLLLTLLLLGTYLFIKKNYFYLIAFALTFYTYSTANLFTPMLLVVLHLIYRPRLSEHFEAKKLALSLVSLVLLLPIAYQLILGEAAGRFNLISIFSDPKITEEIILTRIEPWVDQQKEAVFHNKPIAYLSVFGRQYLESLSPQFLFIHGDPFFRHSIGRYGELLWTTIPFLFLGLSFLLGKLNKSAKLVLAWLLLSPIPSALTKGGGEHATRLFILLPPLIILIALGLTSLSESRKGVKLFFLSFFVLASTLNFSLYLHRYFSHYPQLSADLWGYGYKAAFEALVPYQSEANRVFINNTHQPSLLSFAFYTKLPPKDFHQQFKGDVPTGDLIPGFDGFLFGDKYYFGQLHNDLIEPTYRIPEVLKPGDYYLAVQLKEIPGDWDWSKNPPTKVVFLEAVRDPNDKPLFTIFKLE